MHDVSRKTLAVMGAGPKGIAIAVKAKVLQEFGIPVDRVVLIEKNRVAANWSGEFGFTNGEMKLGTSPDKDVVFPIETDVGDEGLNQRVRQRLLDFSWTSFLVQTQRFSDWVDRGRPAPCHQFWALYLTWVSEQLGPEVPILKAEVVEVDLTSTSASSSRQWRLSLRRTCHSSGEPELETLIADRLVLTGPGRTRMDFARGEEVVGHPGVFDLESFWSASASKSFSASGKIAIVGAGENAASVLLSLGQLASESNSKIDVISPRGFISTRAENFYENQIYSQPERNGWRNLEISDRMEFIERTDLGVFSVHAMQILNEQTRHRVVPGRVTGLKIRGEKIALTSEYGRKLETVDYDQVILATGFDQVAMLRSIFSPRALAAVEQGIGGSLQGTELAMRIQSDLSVQGIGPSLHLPMLAGLMQGPGFSNLSCLGRLSDRIVLGSPELAMIHAATSADSCAASAVQVGALP